tara:strand:- start:180 stop:368 length:189 start_codon:yes stop_codon:yes gene_type:complete
MACAFHVEAVSLPGSLFAGFVSEELLDSMTLNVKILKEDIFVRVIQVGIVCDAVVGRRQRVE